MDVTITMDMDVIVTIMVKGIFSVGAMIEGMMFTIMPLQ
jgi:hypothetical protein